MRSSHGSILVCSMLSSLVLLAASAGPAWGQREAAGGGPPQVAAPAAVAPAGYAPDRLGQEKPAARGFILAVKPGLMLQGGMVGFDLSPQLSLVGGLDFFRASVEIESDSETSDAAAGMYMPNVNIMYHFREREVGRVTPYLAGGLFLLIPSVDGDEMAEDAQDTVDDSSVLGINCGLGAQYHFSTDFSVAAEYGVRLLFGSTKVHDSYWDGEYNDRTGEYEETLVKQTTDIGANVQATYAQMALIYRF